MAEPTTAYIGLGSNLGDRQSSIRRALRILGETPGVQVGAVSDIRETAPLGEVNQPKYLNGAARIRTTLSPEKLYSKLSDIEVLLGRVKREKWSPRTIDLDLLLFGDAIIDSPALTVPHPQMHLRSFVLAGLCQISGELLHPVLKVSMNELAARLNGSDFVLKPDSTQLVSVAGIIGVGKTTLTGKLADALGCESIFEAYDKNPFLAEVYAGNKDLALDSQLCFLTSRIEQLNPESVGRGQIFVADYVFDKELIYARRLLNSQQLALYEKLYGPIEEDVRSPVLVIYLCDLPGNCLERIHRRNRPYEQVISLEFLQELSADYERLFADWRRCPVIRTSMSEFDCMRRSDIEDLAKQIRSYVAV
ncbi:MAG: 2-amino-4-hydroxy-6-hydroxymethyldihydropteridine diphosphokinase [Planctomycetota bacterium]|jgi:2-amino-4-hydroxy-6-hydroxymethyldihydropteridine diphosphokinase